MNKRVKLRLDEYTSLKISIIYFIISALWILSSDQIVYYFVKNPEIITNIQMLKGWFFILITTFIIFILLRREIGKFLESETALRKSEEQYRQLVETMSDGLVMIDANGVVTFVNDRVCEMWQGHRDDILGQPISCYMDKANQEIFKRELEKRKRGGQVSYELAFTRKDGKKVPTLVSPKPIFNAYGQFTGSFAVITETTELKQAEQSLRDSERRYRMLFESANDAILIMQDNKCIECNQKSLEVYGCTREQMIGQPPYTFSPKHQLDGSDSTEKALAKITKALSGEPQVFEWRHLKHNGEPFDAEISLSLIEIESEKYIQAISRDISERKMLIQELQLMKRWVEQSVDLFFWVREDSQVLYVNQAVCHALGYTQEEFCSMRVSDFDLDLTLEAWPDFTEKVKKQGSYRFESRHRNKNGQVFPVEITANTLKYEGKDHFFAYGRDISAKVRAEEKRKELENQLRQSHKMEAIGSLAGGIAHDFNNILSVIFGYTEIALENELPEDSPAIYSLQEVLKAGIRAKDLVKQILTFSRQTEVEKQPVDLKAIIKETTKLLRSAIPTNIVIQKEFLTEEGIILAAPIQVHQIIMNLCTNAAHAMQESGGCLKLNLSEIDVGAEDIIEYSLPKPGVYLNLLITDTGHGMDQLTKEKIFDPFFTTKPKEEGTGLGLSVVHGIVKDHGGKIAVKSEVGKGTSFNIYFPRIASPGAIETQNIDSVPTGKENILVVDDDLQVVDSIVKILKKLGYQVSGISSSSKALDTIRANPKAFDLVITDQTMPEMTGDVLAQEITSIRQDLPIILCTGFSHQVTKEYARTIGIQELLMKPILRNQLAETVRRTLDLSVQNKRERHGKHSDYR